MKKIISLILCALILVSAAALCPVYAEDAPVFNEEDSCTYGIIPGDVNDDGEVNVKDVTRLVKYIAGNGGKLHSSQTDVNIDGKRDIKDAMRILKHIAGWTDVRLGHDDDKEVVAEATAEELGLMRLTCAECNSTADALIPRVGQSEHFTIKGVPLSEYTIVYGTSAGTADLTTYEGSKLPNLLRDTLKTIANVDLGTTKKADSGKYDHEIVIGACDRDCVKDLDPKKAVAGITEDGTVYFHGYSASTMRHLIDAFLQEAFGSPYCENFGATTGRTDFLLNPWGNKLDEWYYEIEELDLEGEGYKLVFEDNFDGDELNLDVWHHRATGFRRDGVDNPEMVEVSNGTLKIKGEYVPDDRYGEGYANKWHADMIALNDYYTRGYFEISAKCADPSFGFWSAFWIQGKAPYTPVLAQGGIGEGGAELDILENNCTKGATRHNVFCGGVTGIKDGDGGYSAYEGGEYYIGDVENEYHTYALLWDEEWYTFYVDGIVVGRTNYGNGTSISPEEVIISLEIGGNMPVDGLDRTTQYEVDYIRIYQK